MIKKLIASGKKLTYKGTSSHSPLSLSIVNTEANGKRIKLSKGLLSELSNPKNVGVIINEENTGILVYESEHDYAIGKGNIIYNSSLINEITDTFKIDFSQHTSHSFNNISIKTDPDDEIKYAEIIFIGK